MVNSLDRDLLDRAAEVINEMLSEESVATAISRGTQVKAVAWLAAAAKAGVNPPRAGWGQADVGSRWRGIDPAGEVATDPTPEPPDDPDEGETGPPEQQG